MTLNQGWFRVDSMFCTFRDKRCQCKYIGVTVIYLIKCWGHFNNYNLVRRNYTISVLESMQQAPDVKLTPHYADMIKWCHIGVSTRLHFNSMCSPRRFCSRNNVGFPVFTLELYLILITWLPLLETCIFLSCLTPGRSDGMLKVFAEELLVTEMCQLSRLLSNSAWTAKYVKMFTSLHGVPDKEGFNDTFGITVSSFH